jgi:hypothetical protein
MRFSVIRQVIRLFGHRTEPLGLSYSVSQCVPLAPTDKHIALVGGWATKFNTVPAISINPDGVSFFDAAAVNCCDNGHPTSMPKPGACR